MNCRLRIWPVLLACLSGDVVRAQDPFFAGIEVHGSLEASASVFGDIPVPALGQVIAADGAVLESLCRQVQERSRDARFLSVTCMAIGFPDGARHVVIDVVEPAEAGRIDYPPMHFIDHMKLTERGSERRSEELIACARGCALPADRADALDFLNRLDWGDASCRAALKALDDRDWTVRNQAAMLLNQHLARCCDALGVERIIDASLRQLTRPTHTDRNKAISTLDLLVRRGVGIDVVRRRQIELAAGRLALRSTLPNVGGKARDLVEFLRAGTSPRIEPSR